MKVSLIVAVYKDIEALSLIVKALEKQTYTNFELVVAEDGECQELKILIKELHRTCKFDILHTTQEDIGIQKMRSLNNAIMVATGEYLIFIDGDCIPYSTFIDGHVYLASKKHIVSGRRCNLGPKYSEKLRNDYISSYQLERSFVIKFPFIAFDSNERHTEAGFYFNPRGYIYSEIVKKKKSSTNLLGCNYSCFKNDILAINGYDEGYGQTAIGDDTDMQWRFISSGMNIISAKNVANVFHLYHTRTFRDTISIDDEWRLFLENKAKNKYICKYGLNTH